MSPRGLLAVRCPWYRHHSVWWWMACSPGIAALLALAGTGATTPWAWALAAIATAAPGWALAASLLNTMEVAVGEGSLVWHHGPVPWPGGRVPLDQVARLTLEDRQVWYSEDGAGAGRLAIPRTLLTWHDHHGGRHRLGPPLAQHSDAAEVVAAVHGFLET